MKLYFTNGAIVTKVALYIDSISAGAAKVLKTKKASHSWSTAARAPFNKAASVHVFTRVVWRIANHFGHVVQVLPDRDGKRCMFCLKTITKTYEMSASDTRQRQEWTSGTSHLHTFYFALHHCLPKKLITFCLFMYLFLKIYKSMLFVNIHDFL